MGPKPNVPRTDELTRPRLDELLKMSHPLVKLSELMCCRRPKVDHLKVKVPIQN